MVVVHTGEKWVPHGPTPGSGACILGDLQHHHTPLFIHAERNVGNMSGIITTLPITYHDYSNCRIPLDDKTLICMQGSRRWGPAYHMGGDNQGEGMY